MKRAFWLVAAAVAMVACIDDARTRRDESGRAGSASVEAGAGGSPDVREVVAGATSEDSAAGQAGAPADDGAAGERAAGGSHDDGGAPPVAVAGNSTGGGGSQGGSAQGGGAGHAGSSGSSGAAGAAPIDPDCKPSNLHALPAKCAGPQPVNCNLGIKDNPNLCTGGAADCSPTLECRPFVDDFSLCRDGRFRSCPAGTCGTAAGDQCQLSQNDVIWPPEFCPCVVLGVTATKG